MTVSPAARRRSSQWRGRQRRGRRPNTGNGAGVAAVRSGLGAAAGGR